ncbi:MAG: outer membrane protein assembly factor BamA [bacterium]|nr:outer membrane protein assembly factor BamA [bacterium]
MIKRNRPGRAARLAPLVALFLGGALFGPTTAGAQFPDLAGNNPATAPGIPVVGVEIQGNRRIEADAILAVLGTRPDTVLSRSVIAADVREIYKLGFFRNVTVVSKDAPGGQIISFVVEENPVIRRVTVTGNSSMGAEEVTDVLTLTVGSTVDRPLIVENQERVKALYQAKGYYLAEVSHEIEPLADGAAGINFSIVEGEKLWLRNVVFRGAEKLDPDDLANVIQTKPWRWTSYMTQYWDNSGLYAEPIFYQDLDSINRLYMDEGFIRVKVGEPEVSITEDGIDVIVDISEGAQFSVGQVDVIGDESMDREQLLGMVGLTPGSIFSRGVLSDDVERVKGFYADRGFFDADVLPRTRVDDEALKVDCAFEVEKKDLYFVDRIEVHGNTRTRDPVVRREMSIAEGELFSAAAVKRSRARVRRLGFFEEVGIEAKRLAKPNRVALGVEVVERPTGSFSFGAGVGSTDGFVLNAAIRQDNLFGTGRALTTNADLGSNNSRFFLRFVEPYIFGTAASFSGTLSQTEREFLDFREQIRGLNFNTSYPLDESQTVFGSGYSFTGREVEGVDQFQASSLLQREEFQGDSTTSMITFSLRRDTRDDIRFPKDGQVSAVAMEYAGIGGLNQFLRLEARTTWFLPLRNRLFSDSTFIINSRIGWAIPLNDLSDFDLPQCTGTGPNDCQTWLAGSSGVHRPLETIDRDLKLPLTERYFLGGLGSFQVRGFKQRSLGPRRTILDQIGFPPDPDERLYIPSGYNDKTSKTPTCISAKGCNDADETDVDDFADLDLTDVIGGNKMFLLNLELQFPISEDLGLTGILFMDMGNAFSENESINPADLRFGTGAGVQWFSPFGPIMVVLGVPLDRLEDEKSSVFEFSLGGSQF